MALVDTMNQMTHLLEDLSKDLIKVQRGNKAAAQRVRMGTIKLTKIGKGFRKESMLAEKSGRFKKKTVKRAKSKKKKIR
jgi:phage-related minor tail protein